MKKIIMKKLHNIFLIGSFILNAGCFFGLVSSGDALIHYQTWFILAFNFAYMCLFAYANGCFIETKPWYERMQKGHKND